MCTIISIINNKGGVGKTTSAAIISELLAYLGKKVLVVDLDQQSNLSMMLGQYQEDSDAVINGIVAPDSPNIAELFRYRFRTSPEVEGLVCPTAIPGLDMIPSSRRHKNTQLHITSNQTGNNNIILKKALDCIRGAYDYILLDNAPANDILTVNSMFASDLVIVPVRVEGFSYKGLQETLETILYIKEEHGIDSLQFKGAFITQAETNTNIFRGIRENYKSELGARFLNTAIRKDIKICEIETNYIPILQYCADTNAVFDYSRLILELGILDDASQQILAASINAA